ncbi:hypothetical protein WG66_002746 [Moniliophthora roreri]|nr:hypothetical protein WG66_002746 [Moniliophthora roreri]
MTTTTRLKRNISTEPQNDSALKKPKIRNKNALHAYETPHPTMQSQSEVYKLPSSVGSHVSPSDFSPILKPSRKATSTNLKENSTVAGSSFTRDRFTQKRYGKNRTRSRVRPAALESPFCSANPSPEQVSASAIQSDSPTLASESPQKTRRPSAPTPPRLSDWKYNPSNTVSAVDLPALKHPKAQPKAPDSLSIFHRSPSHTIDFNRPPSQLSLYDYNRSTTYEPSLSLPSNNEEFSRNIQSSSTPFKLSFPFRSPGGKLYSSRAAVSDTDTDSDSCGWDSGSDRMDTASDSIFRSLRLAARNRTGYTTPSPEHSEDEERTRPRSPWIEDSLISAPNSMEWQAPPRSAAYMRDVEMTDNVAARLDSLMISGASDEGKNKKRSRLPPLEDTEPVQATILRTRSLGDSDMPQPTARRTRSGTIIAAPGIPSLAPALPVISNPFRRTRSGTVVSGKVNETGATGSATGTRRTRSGTVVANATQEALSTVDERERQGSSISIPGFGSRKRSGSVLAPVGKNAIPAPIPASTSTSRRSRSGSIAALANSVGAKLASIPLPGAGMMHRARSGTVIRLPATAPTPPPEEDVDMDDAASVSTSSSKAVSISIRTETGSPDQLDALATHSPDQLDMLTYAPRSGLRSRAKGKERRAGSASAMLVDQDDGLLCFRALCITLVFGFAHNFQSR